VAFAIALPKLLYNMGLPLVKAVLEFFEGGASALRADGLAL
jgi:hypothetical protein